MVAEPWDTSGFGVGSFPSGWSEWNGLYRDNLRQFMKGDNSQVGNLGASIAGSWSGFATPSRSVNFVTAHDGFTLNDLVSYNSKQNGVGPCNPTGADPTSGSDTNYSWDSQQLQKIAGTTYGVEARSTIVLLARSCTAASSVRVDFTVNGFTTSPGQDLYVSGNTPELGNWDITKAVKLNYVNSTQWSGPVFFTTSKGTGIQYKYLMRQGGTTTWETGANRSYTVPSSGSGSVTDSWRF